MLTSSPPRAPCSTVHSLPVSGWIAADCGLRWPIDHTSDAQPGSFGVAACALPSALSRTTLPKWFAGFCAAFCKALPIERPVLRSPSVTNRLPSRANAMREPKWIGVGWSGFCRKTMLKPFEPAARAGRHEPCAGERRAAALGSARFREREIDEAVPAHGRERPPRRAGRLARRTSTGGMPAIGADTLPLRSTIRSVPRTSVTSRRPSGRNWNPHGWDSPLANVSTLTFEGSAGAGARVICAEASGMCQAVDATRTPAKARVMVRTPTARWRGDKRSHLAREGCDCESVGHTFS